jgi:hypothetical protein
MSNQLHKLQVASRRGKHGLYESFATGIRRGNELSEKLCTKLHLSKTDKTHGIAIDSKSFAGSQMTK